ncbi:hypothetical protein DNH61_05915 [Paenibacillus sambharensis]|uniref:DUF3231 domain-containing protein n=1 Tax=Paenibacillus sambharensis TaxID=1803190 RepID=A0A2W1LP80_9BACL|nr:DUF3231 family protein [Paenibacillus sambharensis]PZD96732.1 hypothetical protein DNH61_05915 [Paenibacillus sambharensis]
MNLLETIKDAFKPLMNGEKPPLQVGEVMNLWFYLTATDQTMRGEEVSYNTAQDPELKEAVKDVLDNVHGPIHKELHDFLRDEGVELPVTTSPKPLEPYKLIPEGAKMTDDEIANLLVFNLTLGIQSACQGLVQSTRADVGMMFSRYQMMKITMSIKMKDLMGRKGWLRVPPPYNKH